MAAFVVKHGTHVLHAVRTQQKSSDEGRERNDQSFLGTENRWSLPWQPWVNRSWEPRRFSWTSLVFVHLFWARLNGPKSDMKKHGEVGTPEVQHVSLIQWGDSFKSYMSMLPEKSSRSMYNLQRSQIFKFSIIIAVLLNGSSNTIATCNFQWHGNLVLQLLVQRCTGLKQWRVGCNRM